MPRNRGGYKVKVGRAGTLKTKRSATGKLSCPKGRKGSMMKGGMM